MFILINPNADVITLNSIIDIEFSSSVFKDEKLIWIIEECKAY